MDRESFRRPVRDGRRFAEPGWPGRSGSGVRQEEGGRLGSVENEAAGAMSGVGATALMVNLEAGSELGTTGGRGLVAREEKVSTGEAVLLSPTLGLRASEDDSDARGEDRVGGLEYRGPDGGTGGLCGGNNVYDGFFECLGVFGRCCSAATSVDSGQGASDR